MTRQRVLVTGASGLLGCALVRAWRPCHDVIGASGTLALPGIVDWQGDLSDPSVPAELVRFARPDLLVHCAAWTDVDGCEGDPQRAMRMNAYASGRLAAAAAGRGSAFVYISTEAVFDGVRGGYTEDDTPQPINAYGRSKLAGEQEVLAAHVDALVLRLGLEGWRLAPGRPGFVQWIIEGLRQGERRRIVTDWIHTPVFAANVATVIDKLRGRDERGLFHVGTSQPASNWEVAFATTKVFDLGPGLLDPMTSDVLQLRAPRPANSSLATTRLREAVGDAVWTVETGLTRMRDEEPAVIDLRNRLTT